MYILWSRIFSILNIKTSGSESNTCHYVWQNKHMLFCSWYFGMVTGNSIFHK
jgi:hypothetical protein